MTPAITERAEREWVLHRHTVDSFRSLCAEAGLRITATVDEDGQPVTTTAPEFTATVRRD